MNEWIEDIGKDSKESFSEKEEERGYSTDIRYHNIIFIFYFLEGLIIIVIFSIQFHCIFKKGIMKVINRSNSITSFPSYKLLIFFISSFIGYLSIFLFIHFLFYLKNAIIFLTFFVSLLFRIISKELILPIESNWGRKA